MYILPHFTNITRRWGCPKYTKTGSMISILFILSSCCSLPFVNCPVNVHDLAVAPQEIVLNNGPVKNCKVKAWLIDSRNKKSTDSSTLDVAVGFLYQPSSQLDTLDPEKIFLNGDRYLQANGKKIFFDPVITKRKIESEADPSLKGIEYYFSARVSRTVLQNTQMTFVLKNLDFDHLLKNKIDISVAIHDK
jgi:hypothetical protein